MVLIDACKRRSPLTASRLLADRPISESEDSLVATWRSKEAVGSQAMSRVASMLGEEREDGPIIGVRVFARHRVRTSRDNDPLAVG